MFTFIAKKLVRCVELLEKISPKIHIYHIEDIFVFCVLFAVGLFSWNDYREWIGLIAVFLAFKHTVIAFRLEEVLEQRASIGDTAFNSHGKQTQYFFAKESMWLLYFLLLGALPAVIVGVLFLTYPVWHRIREKYHRNAKYLKSSKKTLST